MVLEQKFGALSQGKKRFWIAILSAICFFCVGLICLVSSRRESIDVDPAPVLNNINVAGDTNNVVIEGNVFSGTSVALTVSASQNVTMVNCVFEGADDSAIIVNAGGKLTLDDCVFRNCHTINDGGAIWVGANGTLNLGDVTIENCSATYGGAICNKGTINAINDSDSKHLSISECTSKNGAGGAIYNIGKLSLPAGTVIDNCSAIITDSSITKSEYGQTLGTGGAIFSSESNALDLQGANNNNITISNCSAVCGGAISNKQAMSLEYVTISNCSANLTGGAIYTDYIRSYNPQSLTNVTITNCSLSSSSKTVGYAIRARGVSSAFAKYNIKNCNIDENNTNNNASASVIYMQYMNATLDNTTISNTGTSIGRAIEIQGSDMVLSNGTVVSGHGSGSNDGAINVNLSSRLTVNDATISSCSGDAGGAIYVSGVDSKVKDNGVVRNPLVTINSGAVITGNTGYYGGAVYVGTHGRFVMNGGEISNNEANCGGGVYCKTSLTTTIKGGKIINNDVSVDGGAVYLTSSGDLVVSGGEFSGNTASWGGAVCALNGTDVTVTAGTFANNEVSVDGGAIYIGADGNLEISNVQISGNTADVGGAICMRSSSSVSIKSGTISHNTSTNQGGAIAVFGSTQFSVTGGHFSNNTGSLGGALYLHIGHPTGWTNKISAGSFELNSATADGGGIYLQGTTLTISGSTYVRDNGTIYKSGATTSSDGRGGGIFARKSTLYITGGTIDLNKIRENGSISRPWGGGIYLCESDAVVSDGTIQKNIARPSASNSCGGNVFVDEDSSFSMTAGSILGDGTTLQAQFGGGIVSTGIVNITGGTISKNVGNKGGGIASYGGFVVDVSDLLGSDEYIYDYSKNNLKIGGNTKIIENKATIGSSIVTGNKLEFSGSPTIDGSVALGATEECSYNLIVTKITLVEEMYPTVSVSNSSTFAPTQPINIEFCQASVDINISSPSASTYEVSSSTELMFSHFVDSHNALIQMSNLKDLDDFVVVDENMVYATTGNDYYVFTNLQKSLIYEDGTDGGLVVSAKYPRVSVDYVVEIPETFDGKSVTTIKQSGFSEMGIRHVTIPASVQTINQQAFLSCTGLQSIKVGSGVKTIGVNAFYGCSAITRVEFVSLNDWDNVELSDAYSNPMFPVQGETTIFNNTEIVSGVYLTIAREEIKQYTYAGFDALCDLRIDTAVQTIGVGAFLGCSGLNVVYATSNWLEIEFADWSSNPLAEANTKKLMIYYWSNGNQYLGDPTGKFSYYSDNTFDLNISNIGAVNPYAFYGCENIKRVLCGYQSDYVEIGDYAFAYSSVEELFLMNANWNVGYWAFQELVSSEFKCFLEMSLDATTPIEGYVDGSIAEALTTVFPNSSATTICFNSNDCGTEAGVLMAEMYAYYDMKISFFTTEGDNDFYFDGECVYADGIESRYPGGHEILAIPGYYLYSDASWTPVEAVMRGNNYALYRLFIGEGVKHVYSGAFSDYDNLGVIILPETLETIGDYAFASRYYEHIFVPESVYYIGEHAFGSGSSGITVYFPHQFFDKFGDEEFVNEHGSFEECFPEFPDDSWYGGDGYCDYPMERRTYFASYYFG